MKHVMLAFGLTASIALLGAGCREETESSWEETGDRAGEALESTGRDISRGAEGAYEGARGEVRELGEEGEEDVERSETDER